MDSKFSAVASKGKLLFKYPDEINGYCIQLEGKELIISIEEKAKFSEKERMYAYFHKAVLGACVGALSGEGWEGIDKVVAEEYLKNECAKDVKYNHRTGEEMYFRMSKSNMSKSRMLKFLIDSIHLLEMRHNVVVMDSQEWKEKEKSGKEFSRVKKLR